MPVRNRRSTSAVKPLGPMNAMPVSASPASDANLPSDKIKTSLVANQLDGCSLLAETLVKSSVANRAALPPSLPSDPVDIRFTQQTVRPTFTNGHHIDAVAKDLSTGKLKAEQFPALEVFALFDTESQSWEWYSLGNRRLYAFRQAHVPKVKVELAKFDEVIGDIWKLTSADGGLTIPKPTQNPDKDSRPNSYTTMHAFRAYCEQSSPNDFKENCADPAAEFEARLKGGFCTPVRLYCA